jgi:hypothetical protein
VLSASAPRWYIRSHVHRQVMDPHLRESVTVMMQSVTWPSKNGRPP